MRGAAGIVNSLVFFVKVHGTFRGGKGLGVGETGVEEAFDGGGGVCGVGAADFEFQFGAVGGSEEHEVEGGLNVGAFSLVGEGDGGGVGDGGAHELRDGSEVQPIFGSNANFPLDAGLFGHEKSPAALRRPATCIGGGGACLSEAVVSIRLRDLLRRVRRGGPRCRWRWWIV